MAGGRRFDLWSKIEQKLHSPFSWMEKEKEIRRGKEERERKEELKLLEGLFSRDDALNNNRFE